MDRDKLIELENKLHEEIVRREALGGYSTDAPGILFLSQALAAVIKHIIEKRPVAKGIKRIKERRQRKK